MRNFLFVLSILVVTVPGCRKLPSPVQQPAGNQEIVFNLNGDGLIIDVRTKADETITSNISEVYWEIIDGANNIVGKSGDTPYCVAAGSHQVATGLYWPSTPVKYTIYVSNVKFTDGVIAADNSTDIVCGKAIATSSGLDGTEVEVALEHIFARTGSLELKIPDYEVSSVIWEIRGLNNSSQSGTAGIYTIGGSWKQSTPLKQQEFDSSSNLYLIPGNYLVFVTYTISKGDYCETITKRFPVDFKFGGTIYSISVTASGNAIDIDFEVSVTVWESTTSDYTFT